MPKFALLKFNDPAPDLELPYYDDIADHPSVDLLLHGVMGMDWNQTFDGSVAP